MVPEKPEETFRVSDRRRRSPEDEPPAAQAASRPEGSRTPTPEPRKAPPGPGAGLVDEPERNLVGLFMMLASSAAISMGDAPDPVTGRRHHDLANAADAIDLLMLLREKTESHRSTAETEALDELLYDLQLRYVNATNRSGRPPVPPRS
jgi:hypothetical protein